MGVTLSTSGLQGKVNATELDMMAAQTACAHKVLAEKSGAGNDFLGWVNLPADYDKEEFARIQAAAAKIQKSCQVLVVIGIGGSYLGARAAIEFVKGSMYNSVRDQGVPEVYFAGNNISTDYLQDIVKIIGDRDFCINVISKSGTTTEPAIAFRVFKALAEERYGKDGAKSRIFATTDKARGALKSLADAESYETFVVPDDVGGRFSVLTPVGLLPMAAAGVDLEACFAGAADAMVDCAKAGGLSEQYAALRNILLRKGKNVEVLVNYDPALVMFGEWFKQLYAESEGKDTKGIFPVSANFSTDLHSIGQFIQDGARIMFETVLWVKEQHGTIAMTEEEVDGDGLNYLAGKDVQFINSKAYAGTLLAHMDGGTPNIVIEVDKRDEYHLGYLMYFFERAVGISGYLLGINPFDQPGVEAYKKNMFALLGKPGYEALKAELEARLG